MESRPSAALQTWFIVWKSGINPPPYLCDQRRGIKRQLLMHQHEAVLPPLIPKSRNQI
jgi:hypothetical protein